jgi:hypothetical protein
MSAAYRIEWIIECGDVVGSMVVGYHTNRCWEGANSPVLGILAG